MIDQSLVFDGTFLPSTGVAITATRVSTNILDLLAFRDVGAGNKLELHVLVTQTFLTNTSLTIELQSAITSGGAYVGLMDSPTYAVANLLAGTELFQYKVPKDQLNRTGNNGLPFRFFRLNYTIGGSNATAGAVFAYLTGGGDQPTFMNYPRGFTIDA